MQQGSKIKRFGLLFMHHFQMAEVTTSAAVLAYYTLLSVFPALLVIGNLLPMMALTPRRSCPTSSRRCRRRSTTSSSPWSTTS